MIQMVLRREDRLDVVQWRSEQNEMQTKVPSKINVAKVCYRPSQAED